ncbi:MAG: hypothetical protein D3903_00315 [Candidatus Electrothrix sp. GM3_4]|nr:hypothetical protein [Candidatus Electrothrix sp. GM3_4]
MPVGDMIELQAIRHVFGNSMPRISSTKSLSEHSLAAAGVHEAIYCLLMLNNFIAASANIHKMEADTEGIRGHEHCQGNSAGKTEYRYV